MSRSEALRAAGLIAASVALLVGRPGALRAQPGEAFPAPYDLLVTGGHVIDGTGSPWFRADVAIRGDRIAGIGRALGPARDTLDAAGMVAAPGFIDMLGHSEFRLLADGRAISKITQGITTEITGEVSSVAPAGERAREERLREVGVWIAEYAWDDLDGYLAELERRGTAINLGTWIGLSTLRVDAVGWDERPATAGEMGAMEVELEKAMAQGAFGLSAGLIYPPGRYTSTDDIVELARVAAERGGIYATHVRSEGPRLLEAIDEAIAIGERSGAAVLIHHLKASGERNWGRMVEVVERVEAARGRGVDVTASVYPYLVSYVGHSMSEEDLLIALRQPWVMIGGDAGVRALDGPLSHDTPHPRAYGAFPRILCRYARGVGPYPDEGPEQRVLSLEEAVQKMTGLPAARAGLAERGVLKTGLHADVTVFDPATVCDRATFEDPKQLSVGIRHVVVNGVPALRDGQPTGALPGRGLRLRPADVPLHRR